ncbi:MAG: M23 family metallopeptidase [Syntrophales bacterium]|nr:M23 family metallopeptidase [Syntrophales bacterium]
MRRESTLKITLPDPWKARKVVFSSFFLVLLIVVIVAFFFTLGEFGKPIITVSPITHIGQKTTITAIFADDKTGLYDIQITITQGKDTHSIVMEKLKEKTTHKSISFSIEPKVMKLTDGPATLSFIARDRSIWKNEGKLHLLVTIDATPPQISILSPITYINPGGTGAVAFRVSKPVNVVGIKVGEDFFPAYPASINGTPGYLTYFAYPPDESAGQVAIKVYVRDLSGNEVSAHVDHSILKRKFRHDKMPLSDQFLEKKMPEFVLLDPSLKGKSMIDVFIHVNSTMRKENNEFIRQLCTRSEAKKLWEGSFLRMRNASPMAQFGDRRTYTYQGKEIGTSIHQGVDLASTANASIEAANNGIVVFTGSLGIYGNTVIIDHGQGLFSLYAHLASIKAQKGQTVKKGEIIGVSGQTGLAGGDHLHFSIIVSGQFVDPREWWDAHWIKDNVEKKLGDVR